MFDVAHAFGRSYKGTMIGNFGRCDVLSFHATKFFNTFEGGAVLTNDDEFAEKMRLMRNFGFSGMDNVIHPGTNGKMTEICAAMGLVNLENIDTVLESNQINRQVYREGILSLPGIRLFEFDDTERNNYQYVVIEIVEGGAVSRDSLIETLHAQNVLARKYFWPGCHNMKPFKELFPHAGLLLPNTKDVAEKVIVLPTGVAMTTESVGYVCEIIRVVMEGAI